MQSKQIDAIIRGGTVVTPSGVAVQDIAITDGKISALGNTTPSSARAAASTVRDTPACLSSHWRRGARLVCACARQCVHKPEVHV